MSLTGLLAPPSQRTRSSDRTRLRQSAGRRRRRPGRAARPAPRPRRRARRHERRRRHRRPVTPSAAGQGGAVDAASDARQGGRFVLAITATAREAEDLTSALASLLPDPHAAEYFPAWETLPHERLSPRSDTSGRRLAVLRRLVRPDHGDPRSGPLQRRRHADPQRPAAARRRARPARAGPAGPGQAGRTRRRGRQAGRDRLRQGRPRHQPRRDRGPRRHTRRVPADGRAPAAGRVLRLGDRGDQAVPGGRPALAGHDRPTRCGRRRAASCCSPRPSGTGPSSSPASTRASATCSARWRTGSRSRAWRRSRRCSPTGWSCCSTRSRQARWWSPATRSGSGPAPPIWCGPARNSSRPRGSTRRAGAEVPIDLGGAAFRPITEVRAAAVCPGHRVVDDHAVRHRRSFGINHSSHD